ncbi:MAG: hypothetical protein WCK89_20455 [bacterium]
MEETEADKARSCEDRLKAIEQKVAALQKEAQQTAESIKAVCATAQGAKSAPEPTLERKAGNP